MSIFQLDWVSLEVFKMWENVGCFCTCKGNVTAQIFKQGLVMPDNAFHTKLWAWRAWQEITSFSGKFPGVIDRLYSGSHLWKLVVIPDGSIIQFGRTTDWLGDTCVCPCIEGGANRTSFCVFLYQPAPAAADGVFDWSHTSMFSLQKGIVWNPRLPLLPEVIFWWIPGLKSLPLL